MRAPTLIWFGFIQGGYDGLHTIGLFEKEPGGQMPADKTEPNRFSKRYEFLTFTSRDAWLELCCRQIEEPAEKSGTCCAPTRLACGSR